MTGVFCGGAGKITRHDLSEIGWDEPGSHPGRASYLSGGLVDREQGTVIKDWGGRFPVALIYPNSYYIGMSNLGFQSIYRLLNSYRDCVCERVFWEGGGKALQAVESARPLTDFACLAFSFSYELDYLNLAAILRVASIPLYSRERDESHPLLIAGGPCITANPAPTAPFFDALCIGEAEVLLPSMLPVLSADLSRKEKLQKLAQLSGIYIPSCHDGHTISRRWVKNLDDFPAHSVVLTPDTELGSLYLIEVERGCNWNCRFCLVSQIFCPTRFRSLDNLLGQAREGLKYRRRIGLVGPVVSDHPQIEELLCGLLEMGAGFSLSSLRLKPLPSSLLELIVKGGAQSLAIAPEAGSERLRRAIRKGFTETDILAAVERVTQQPLRQLKLYFMIGLPGESGEDVEAIIHLAAKCHEIARGSALRLSLNIAPFVPKAGTAFQLSGMADVTTLEKRIARINDDLAGKGITVRSESPQWSHVQGALSRGGAGMAEVLANIEKPSLAGWRRAVKRSGLDIEHYVTGDWREDTPLPWGMVSSNRRATGSPRR